MESKNAYLDTACPERRPLFVVQPPTGDDGRPKIRKVLIANRGEIACRVIATCRKLSITSIAVYVEEDLLSRHVTDADEAIKIGSIVRAKTNPFLNIELLVKTAFEAGADAVHPGYGYLSENPDFAQAVRDAGLIFIGPTATAMSTLGDKRSSKDYLRKHAPEVPLIPGFEGDSQNAEDLERAAIEIGYPVMLKASAGGGGRGIRIVREQRQLSSELERAQSEASRSFGSSDCILEKYIEQGKHIEIQIFGDGYGNVISLGERDCSVQRRHQKVIEETPCPLLLPETRQKMSDTAVLIGSLIQYEGAGTVEFVFDVQKHSFYFLEVNARLQVEHPITEEVTGFDLVSLQLYVAAGGNLTRVPALSSVVPTGHAIECRLCAEDPQKDFFPEHGKLLLWQTAENVQRDIRYETAIQTSSQVSIHFDSMIAKIVVWAPTRTLAIEKMTKVLASTVCIGVKTNQIFLQSCLLHPGLHNPLYTTMFIQNNLRALLQSPYTPEVSRTQKLLSVVPAMYARQYTNSRRAQSQPRPFAHVRRGFRNQYFDPIGRQCNIMTVVETGTQSENLSTEAMIFLWDRFQSEEMGDVHIGSVAECTKSTGNSIAEPKDEVSSASTHMYNAISSRIRDGSLLSAPAHRVKIHDICGVSSHPRDQNSTLSAWVDASIDGSKITACLVVGGSNDSPLVHSKRIFCHFPCLGTWTEYQYDTLLSYCEHLREATGALVSTESRTVRAPMPCKILSIIKKNGDDVRMGENVMIIESMKMEMSISTSADGKFSTSLRKGDAVDEGKILCEVL